jgi:microcystin-dependent protein
MQDPFLGQITFYPYNFAPLNWAMCMGQVLPISQNPSLFALLGTNYGGNGTSTFALPDLRGRVPVGQGQLLGGELYELGEELGPENVMIDSTTMAAHSHLIEATTAQGTVNNPAGNILASPFVGGKANESTGQPYNVSSTTPSQVTLTPASLATAGSSLPHNNLQPSLVLTPCIALRGVFPSRN